MKNKLAQIKTKDRKLSQALISLLLVFISEDKMETIALTIDKRLVSETVMEFLRNKF